MRFNSRTWYLLSLLLFVAAVWFWLRGNEEVAKRDAAKKKAAPQGHALPQLKSILVNPPQSASPAAAGGQGTGGGAGGPAGPVVAAASRDRFPYRLRNTDQTLDQLGLSDTAVLLDNAFIDTANRTPPLIPEHLRAVGDPGTYIIQPRGPLSAAFYDRLRIAGAEFVSYIPNNAALVRATDQIARELAAQPQMQAVLRYEPYYKLAKSLLPLAVEQQSLPLDSALNVTVYPRQRDAAVTAFQTLGAEVIAEGKTPFGPLLTLKPHADSLVALAQLAVVQRIEYATPRTLLNDLSRTRVSVSTDTVTTNNYLDLTGSNVLVNINDTGVDATHPDLKDRVFTVPGLSSSDADGHGTHVAGTLAGSGESSSNVITAASSVSGANFRGMAPAAKLFVLPVDLRGGPLISDSYLQETAARTNAFISNNSWSYGNLSEYNASSASYDAAVRDALSDMEGSQPVLYVFAAGNSGFGSTNGTVGHADSIPSPATAKNVITVGAIEQRRDIANEYYVTNVVGTNVVVVTNVPFLGMTDSHNEVADFSSRGNVGIGSEGEFGRFKPDLVAPGTFVVSTRATEWRLENFIRLDSPLYPILLDLNTGLGAYYRYESGTSMAAPAVSGVLALMQEFFERRLRRGFSPALMKALLINGARTVNANYDLEVRTTINFQGWGLVNLTNSLPEAWTNTTDEANWPVRFIDQSPTNVLATGQRHTWNLSVSTNAQFYPLRVTLVWTDPPGNPSAALKLVNDLDLVVTNLASGEVYFGNNFPSGFDFTVPNETDGSTNRDFVNNVENVFLDRPLSTNYSITVVGRRVNVNAVTADNTGVAQDYALVVSTGNSQVTNALPPLTAQPAPPLRLPQLTVITNGVALLNERVGANYQLNPSTNGLAEQWRFYVFTNAFFTNDNPSGLTNGSNVAFVTFLPPNLSRTRVLEADIDLYVSTNPQLTNLDATVITNAWQSRNRGGTELIVLTNAAVGLDAIFYIGVKSEDQQGGEYGIAVFSSDLPFDSEDQFGNRILRGVPPNAPIPDGAPNSPGYVPVFAFGVVPVSVARVIVTNVITHEAVGDLLGNFSHEDQFAVLNNHNLFDGSPRGFYSAVYDDSGSGQFYSRHTDGPGTLNDFMGQISAGVWLLTMTDDSPDHSGFVNNLTVRIEPNRLSSNFIADSVLANQWNYYFVDVPADATNLTVNVRLTVGDLNVYLRRGEAPTTTEFDKSALISAPGGSLSLGLGDVPPLNAGRYFIGVFNPSASTVNYEIQVLIGRNPLAADEAHLASIDTPLNLLDDALTRSTIFVPSARPVVDVKAAVRIDHPRASDLVLHLVSPQGTRTLLAENRGGTNTSGYGATITTTNVFPRNFDGGPEEDRNVIDTGQITGTIKVVYDFYPIPDRMRMYYEGVRIFDSGLVSGPGSISVNYGPGNSTAVTIVMNEGGSTELTTRWTYTATIVRERILYTTFTENTNLADTPIKFAMPPFTNSPASNSQTNRLVMDDGFEGVPTGTYSAGTFISGWQVTLGQVIVHGVSNPLGILPNTGTNFVELDSTREPSGVLTNVNTVVNREYILSFAYHRNPAAAGPHAAAIYTNGVLAKFVLVPTAAWQSTSFVFRAVSPTTAFEIRSATAVGPLLDTVRVGEIVDQQNFYYFPEEPLKPFVGESALGNWTLEIWDNRVGPLVPERPKLAHWELQFVFANTNPPAITLTNCIPVTNVVSVYETDCVPLTNTVSGSEIKYFIVNVPRSATMATNVLSSSADLVLYFNHDGLPNGTLGGDLTVDDNAAGGEVLILGTNTPLPGRLRPGQRYYLGVGNFSTNETNPFTLSVAFDRIDASLVNPITLTNGIAYSAAIPATNAIDYYQFAVSTNATTVRFDVTMTNGNVDLVVRKALPIADPLPRPNPGLFDYIGQNPGTAPELITINTNSQPVPLTPGIWYLGVFNVDTNPVSYAVTATESTTAAVTIIPLANAVPLNYLIASGSAFTNFFLFTINQTNSAVLFELYNLNADADLLVDGGRLPDPLNPFASASGSPTRPGQVVFRTNASFPLLNGDWYLAVDNLNNANLNFTIRAAVSTNGLLSSGLPLLVSVTPADLPAIGFNLTWYSIVGEKYQIDASADLIDWTPIATVDAADVFSTYFVPFDSTQPLLFYRVRQIP